MKRNTLVVVLGLLASSTTFACPNLAGTFRCGHEAGTTVITQHLDGQSWSYTFEFPSDPSSVSVVADGTARNYGSLHSGNTSFSCEADQVLHESWSESGDVLGSTTFTLDSRGDIQSVSTVTVGGNIASTSSETCARQ